MESFLTAIPGRRGDDATAKAQDVMYEAWERITSRSGAELRAQLGGHFRTKPLISRCSGCVS